MKEISKIAIQREEQFNSLIKFKVLGKVWQSSPTTPFETTHPGREPLISLWTIWASFETDFLESQEAYQETWCKYPLT